MNDRPRDDSDVPDYAAMLSLRGQVHVVLGAGLGIGRQTAHALASAGATVVCVDREPDLADRVAAAVGGTPWSGDVTNDEAVAALMSFIGERLTRLDGVVDIIGDARYRRLLDTTDDDWAWHRTVGLNHAVLALRHGSALMASGGGGCFNFVASVNGLSGTAYLAPYSAEKAALLSVVRTAAVELGPDGIRVNAVAPGIVRTPRQQANSAWTPELLERNVANTPLRRLGSPPDVAAALLFLASPMARHITGQALVIDGGLSIANHVVTPTPT
jgi:NAD(P)-dependent dehydrogenase (short-subunit alcohol dehydrogenase family)